MKIRLAAEARREMYRAASRYDNLRSGLGDEFLIEVADALKLIREFPAAWPQLGKDYRRHPLSRFPYVVVFEPRSEEVVIIAVGHAKRGPRYWKSTMRRSA